MNFAAGYTVSGGWIETLSALIVPSIAGLAAFIAYYQWRTNEKRLRHELFDRRYKKFEAVIEFIRIIVNRTTQDIEDQQAFLKETRGMKFLFDDEVAEYVDKRIWHLAIDLELLNSQVSNSATRDERTKYAAKRAEKKKQAIRELQNAEAVFDKFLRIDHPSLFGKCVKQLRSRWSGKSQQ